MEKKIVLIVGPSGVGKDTLLRHAKDLLKHNEDFNFVKRYITRPADSNEDNFYVKDEAFCTLEDNDYFISSWRAHSNCYGIAKECIDGKINIISISRAHVKDFEKAYDDVTTVHITIPRLVLLERLRLRGRETEAQIMQRIKRTYEDIEAKNIVEFDNNQPLEESACKFIKLLKKIENGKTI